MPGRSRPGRSRAPTASPSTTSCCASRRTWATPRATRAARRSSTSPDARLRAVRILAVVFVALIVTLQYPMWLGKGGWLMVRDLDRRLAAQQADNARLQARNDALEADVRDLKTGFEAIEE